MFTTPKDTAMTSNGSAEKCTLTGWVFEPLSGSKKFITRQSFTLLKQLGQTLPDTPELEEIPEVTELDELETFVGRKKN